MSSSAWWYDATQGHVLSRDPLGGGLAVGYLGIIMGSGTRLIEYTSGKVNSGMVARLNAGAGSLAFVYIVATVHPAAVTSERHSGWQRAEFVVM